MNTKIRKPYFLWSPKAHLFILGNLARYGLCFYATRFMPFSISLMCWSNRGWHNKPIHYAQLEEDQMLSLSSAFASANTLEVSRLEILFGLPLKDFWGISLSHFYVLFTSDRIKVIIIEIDLIVNQWFG